VEEKAFKAIAKKIESTFHCFETDIMESRDLIKSLTASMALANEEISSIKDLLSRKANFSDVVHYVESKADKHDLREIRSRLNDTAQTHPVMVRQLSETVAARNELSLIESPKRLKSVIKTPRTEFIAPMTHRESRREKSGNSRADLEGTARKLLIRDTKKKVMKSYGSLINDLRN
jgi:ribosomal protein L34E